MAILIRCPLWLLASRIPRDASTLTDGCTGVWLLGIGHPVCERVLQRLVSDGALYYTSRGASVAAPSAGAH